MSTLAIGTSTPTSLEAVALPGTLCTHKLYPELKTMTSEAYCENQLCFMNTVQNTKREKGVGSITALDSTFGLSPLFCSFRLTIILVCNNYYN